MPTRPLAFCPRCNGKHHGRCPDAPRKQTRRFYSMYRWQQVRKLKRSITPLCERCEAQGKVIIGDLVHHIIPLEDGGSPLDLDNLETLCTTCHNREHHAASA